MRQITEVEFNSVSGGDTVVEECDETGCQVTIIMDPIFVETTREAVPAQNAVLNFAIGTVGAMAYGLIQAGSGPVGATLGSMTGMVIQGTGQYNSAQGPGPGGTQQLPPSLPVTGP